MNNITNDIAKGLRQAQEKLKAAPTTGSIASGAIYAHVMQQRAQDVRHAAIYANAKPIDPLDWELTEQHIINKILDKRVIKLNS